MARRLQSQSAMKQQKPKFNKSLFAPSRKHLQNEILDMIEEMDPVYTMTTPESLRSMSRKRLLETHAFWKRVVAYETSKDTTLAKILIEEGTELPLPESMDKHSLNQKLWEVIRALADTNSYLVSTDHLSDRELYTALFETELNRPTKDPRALSGFSQIDLLGSGCDESTRLYYTYYADAHEREMWLDEFPDYEMPAHMDPPYDRDRHLP